MIIDSAPAREITIPSAATACAKAIGMPTSFGIVHAFTIATAVGLQLLGLYAVAVTFGAWITLALYAVSGLAVVLRHIVVGRATSCSLGD